MDETLNNAEPLVSVVLPVYNAEKYIRDAIRSVLDQDYSFFELIIVDDGSSDRTHGIVSGFLDKRIVFVSNDKNSGLVYTLNKGFKIAKGKYIARMDADDICLTGRLRAQVNFLETNTNVSACGTDYISFSEDKYDHKVSLKGTERLKTYLLFSPPLCHPSVMLRKETIEKNALKFDPDFKHVEDYEFWTRLVLKSDIENIPGFYLLYRDHAQQVTHRFRKTQIENSLRVQKNYLMALGFTVSDEALQIHNFISSGQRINDLLLLGKIYDHLSGLISINRQKKIISEDGFNFIIGKYWYDCCGNTSLGRKAYKVWKNSLLKNYFGSSLKQKIKQQVKCFIRKGHLSSHF